MQISQWPDRTEKHRQGWQVIADSVISARSARPGREAGATGEATEAQERAKRQTDSREISHQREVMTRSLTIFFPF